jgi:hypothetical protein
MRITPVFYGAFVVTIFLGIILGFQAAGVWSISGKVDASGEQVQASAADVNTIKGWMTLEQIATTFNVPLADMYTQFDLPADTPPSTAIKDLESDTFDTTALREWLQRLSQTVEVPQTNSVTPVPTQIVTPTPDALISVTPVSTEHVVPEKTVTGKTTFQELLYWGVSVEAIQKVIGSELPASSTVIKDYVTGKGLEFTPIKAQLHVEVDQVM